MKLILKYYFGSTAGLSTILSIAFIYWFIGAYTIFGYSNKQNIGKEALFFNRSIEYHVDNFLFGKEYMMGIIKYDGEKPKLYFFNTEITQNGDEVVIYLDQQDKLFDKKGLMKATIKPKENVQFKAYVQGTFYEIKPKCDSSNPPPCTDQLDSLTILYGYDTIMKDMFGGSRIVFWYETTEKRKKLEGIGRVPRRKIYFASKNASKAIDIFLQYYDYMYHEDLSTKEKALDANQRFIMKLKWKPSWEKQNEKSTD